ncbi:hypothetical protein J7L13_03615 [bacterium]|nr:hypothetical protein [bacterium]
MENNNSSRLTVKEYLTSLATLKETLAEVSTLTSVLRQEVKEIRQRQDQMYWRVAYLSGTIAGIISAGVLLARYLIRGG